MWTGQPNTRSGQFSISALGKIGPLTSSELFAYAEILESFIFSGNSTIVVHLGYFDIFPSVDFSCPSIFYCLFLRLPRWHGCKESTCQCRRSKRCGFNPWTRKIPWRRARQHTPVFLPGESHGQRSLAGYSPWDRKRLKPNCMTEHTSSQPLQSAHFYPTIACILSEGNGDSIYVLVILYKG